MAFHRSSARGIVAAAAVAVLALAPSARAQRALGYEQPHMVRFGVAGGAIVPTSDARSALKTGVHGQAFVLVNVLPSLPLRVNLGYQRMSLKDALAGGSTAPTGHSSMLSGVAGTQIDLLRGPFRPYIVAGVGGFDVRNSVTALSTTTTSSDLRFGVDGGAGVAVKLGRLSAFVEGRVQNVYTKDTGVINSKDVRAVPVSFGLLF